MPKCQHNREYPADRPGCDRCEQESRERLQMERNARLNESQQQLSRLQDMRQRLFEVKS